MYDYDRVEEQQSMLDQVADIVADKQPDVFLLAGDVFDSSAPSASAQKMYVQAMLKICEASKDMQVVVIAGNHDSAAKLDVEKDLWEVLRVHTICYIEKEHLENLIIELPGKGFVIAVPYCYDRNMPENLWQDLQDMVAQRNTNHLPVVMMAHTAVAGMDFTGHKQQDTIIGNIESVAVETMGNGYDYLALGHIHKPQYIHTGNHNVCYSGSPIDISFDEKFAHTVNLVQLESNAVPVVEKLPIKNVRPLINIPENGFLPWEEVKARLEKIEDNLNAYVRLNVEVDGHLPTSAMDTASEIAEGKHSRLCCINEKQKRAECNTENVRTAMTIEELKTLSPIEMAEQYMKRIGRDFTDDMREVIEEAMQQVENEERNN